MGCIDGAPKELRRVLVTAEKAGVTVALTGSGHYQLRGSLDGVGWVLHVSQTPKNVGICAARLKRDLKKKGIAT